MESTDARPFHLGMVMFDRMTNLDLVGPADMFARLRGVRLHLIAPTLDALTTDSGARVLPDTVFESAPKLDVLFVPGGYGVGAAMANAPLIAFLKASGAEAQWVTSVCTGALLLGAAGLLNGYQATTHWSAMDLLADVGAIPVQQRVVIDRNRITCAGVTAGLDFALTTIATIWGQDQAEMVQLGSEYAPQPPFAAGSPLTAPAALVERFRSVTGPMHDARKAAIARALR